MKKLYFIALALLFLVSASKAQYESDYSSSDYPSESSDYSSESSESSDYSSSSSSDYPSDYSSDSDYSSSSEYSATTASYQTSDYPEPSPSYQAPSTYKSSPQTYVKKQEAPYAAKPLYSKDDQYADDDDNTDEQYSETTYALNNDEDDDDDDDDYNNDDDDDDDDDYDGENTPSLYMKDNYDEDSNGAPEYDNYNNDYSIKNAVESIQKNQFEINTKLDKLMALFKELQLAFAAIFPPVKQAAGGVAAADVAAPVVPEISGKRINGVKPVTE